MSSPEAVANAVQAARFGAYTKLAANVTQAGRPVYQLAGSTVAYLFYSARTGEWRIGSDYLSDSSSVKSTGNAGAACPDQATAWVTTYPITVVPTPPTTAAPITVGNRSRHVRMRFF